MYRDKPWLHHIASRCVGPYCFMACWVCEGRGRIGFGRSLRDAWLQWLEVGTR